MPFAFTTSTSRNFSEALLLSPHREGSSTTQLEHALCELKDDALHAFLDRCPAHFSEAFLTANLLSLAVRRLKGDSLRAFLDKCPSFSEELLSTYYHDGGCLLHVALKKLKGKDLRAFLDKCPEKFSNRFSYQTYSVSDAYTITQLEYALESLLQNDDLLIFLLHCPYIPVNQIPRVLDLISTSTTLTQEESNRLLLSLTQSYLAYKLDCQQADTQARISDFATLLVAIWKSAPLPSSSIPPGHFFSNIYNQLRDHMVAAYRKDPEAFYRAVRDLGLTIKFSRAMRQCEINLSLAEDAAHPFTIQVTKTPEAEAAQDSSSRSATLFCTYYDVTFGDVFNASTPLEKTATVASITAGSLLFPLYALPDTDYSGAISRFFFRNVSLS